MPAIRRAPGTVWNPKPAETTPRVGPSASELKSLLHRHGCSTCSATYEDACESPLTNKQCRLCRRGEEVPLWERNLRPQECCTTSKPATPQERKTYRLGGDTDWFMCPKCKRPHIFKPRKKDTP